uniref:Secreted protein n=1 Tax=Bursaphelenchus xylophilus TaxID=6326 RepID=A0A1I7SIS9_BURXY
MSHGSRYYLHRGTIVSALVGTALLIISATTPHFYVGDRSAWTYIDKPENSSRTHEVSPSQPSGNNSQPSSGRPAVPPLPSAHQAQKIRLVPD